MLRHIQLFFLKYGLLIVLLSVLQIFNPDFTAKALLLDLDLNALSDVRSGSSITRQMFWVLLFIFYSTNFISFRIKLAENKEFVNKCLLILCVCSFAFVSVLWSEYPSFAFRRSVFLFVYSAVICFSVYYACIHKSVVQCIRWASLICIAYISIALVLGVGFTQGFALVGHFNSKNTLGAAMMVMVVLNLLFDDKLPQRYLNRNFLLILLIGCLLLSASKTNIAILGAMFCLFIFSVKILRILSISTLVVLSMVFVLMPLSIFIGNEFVVISDFVDDEFITGRGEIWSAIYYDLFKFNKLGLGYGFGSFFGVPVLPYYFDDSFSFLQYINTAHNGYIELLVQFGVFISCVILAVFGYMITKMQYKIQFVGVFVPIIQNITESTLLGAQSIVFLLLIILLIRHQLPNP